MTVVLRQPTCGDCGALVHERARYCPGCGQRREHPASGATFGRVLLAALLVLLALPVGLAGAGCALLGAMGELPGLGSMDVHSRAVSIAFGALLCAVALGVVVASERLLRGQPAPHETPPGEVSL